MGGKHSILVAIRTAIRQLNFARTARRPRLTDRTFSLVECQKTWWPKRTIGDRRVRGRGAAEDAASHSDHNLAGNCGSTSVARHSGSPAAANDSREWQLVRGNNCFPGTRATTVAHNRRKTRSVKVRRFRPTSAMLSGSGLPRTRERLPPVELTG
jgi:hypothetical protein